MIAITPIMELDEVCIYLGLFMGIFRVMVVKSIAARSDSCVIWFLAFYLFYVIGHEVVFAPFTFVYDVQVFLELFALYYQ